MCDSLLPYLSRGQVKNQNAFYRSLGRLFSMNIQPKIWCSCLFCSKDCILPKCFREKDVLWLEMNGRQKAHIFWTGRKVFFVGRLVRRLSSFFICVFSALQLQGSTQNDTHKINTTIRTPKAKPNTSNGSLN